MADIAITAAQIAPIDVTQAEIYTFIAGATITKGQVVYLTTTGTADLANAAAGATTQARGIALNGGGAGQAIDVLKRGRVAGFTVSGMNASAPVFLSAAAAGALATATGGTSTICGIVTAMSDKDKTKVLYADFRWGPDWA